VGSVRSGPGDLLVIDGDEPNVAGLVNGLSDDHPVIVLATLARTPPAIAALGGRPYRQVAKPPDPEDLAAAVRELRSKNRTQCHERQSTATGLTALTLAGSRILYADDQHVNRLVVAGQLKRLGIDVELATGGAEVIDMALADTWDLILLDCQMPEVDGFTAAARIRERGCRTPLVAVTAHAMAGDREECLLRGFDDYLPKPVRPSELVATLSRWINAERTAPAPTPTPPSRLASLREEVGDEVLREVVQAMLTEGPRLADEAVAACSIGDLTLAGRRAHALKGDAGNLGLDEVASLSKALEMAARSGDRNAASSAAARLPEAWRQAELNLRTFLAANHA
jgi:CheY-like chemotaxis protein/HPt (histidine-containing phosphotransfer) domain-containing protein